MHVFIFTFFDSLASIEWLCFHDKPFCFDLAALPVTVLGCWSVSSQHWWVELLLASILEYKWMADCTARTICTNSPVSLGR